MTSDSPANPGGRPAPADPYRWLEEEDAARVLAWTAAQERAFESAAAGWEFRKAAYTRLTELTARAGALNAPRSRGERLFLTRLLPGADQSQLITIEPTGETRILLDPARLDPGGTTTLEAWEPSWDGKLLAYQVATGGTEDSRLFVLDVDSLEILDGPIDRVRRSTVAWLDEHRGFYYVRRLHPRLIPGEERYHRRVYCHALGTDADADPVVFGAGRDKTQHYAVRISPDGRWLVISASAGTSPRKDLWLADLASCPPAQPVLRAVLEGYDARSRLLIRAGTAPDGVCYVITDLDAPRGQVVTTTPADPAPRTWQPLLAEGKDTTLEDFVILDGPRLDRPQMVVARTRHAVGELTVHDASDGSVIQELPVPACGTIGTLTAPPSDAGDAWFTFSTFTTPTVILRYDARSGVIRPWPVPGVTAPDAPGAPGALRTRQLTCSSRDGTPIRMFVIAQDGTPSGPRPAILTGYGGFGASMVPAYSPEAIAWAELGGVYAAANIRGGGEEGRAWHEAGMREHKHKVFEDFEAAADHLIAEGWTTPDKLGIWGASNGGLLVGAALTRHPEKYAAVGCVAPLLDMIRYEESGLGPSWTSEYGSAADPDQYEWLMSYSPYHHVRPGTRYPAVMFAVFDGDTRVDPLHARKTCAALQQATSSGKPVLFRLERGAGHGARSMSRRSELYADLLAFFADQLGLLEG